MDRGLATARHAQLASGRSASVGRILVVHSPGADAEGDEIADRLRQESYVAFRRPVSRTLVDDNVDDNLDVVVVRYVLGSFDLVRLCHDLRDAFNGRIVVVVSGDPDDADASDEPEDEFVVEVLDAGADDFLSSDISNRVLAARLRVAMRSRPERQRPPRHVTIGDVVIDADAHILLVGEEVVKCPPLQFQLLIALARRAGTMVSRDTLFAELWGVPAGAVDPRRLRIAISLLRGVLGRGPQRPVIESVTGSGYRLSVPSLIGNNTTSI